MEASFSFITYLGGGGHPSLSFVGAFLLLDIQRSFGAAVDRIEFLPHVDRRDRPLAADNELSERFEKHIRSLPGVWFTRKERLIELSYVSQLGYAEELIFQKHRPLSLEQFDAACREVAINIPIIQKTLRTTDDFDLDAFHTHVQLRLEQVPTTEAELNAVLKRLASEQKLLP